MSDQKRLEELYRQILKKKRVTYTELDELLPEDVFSAEEIEEIITNLQHQGVQITDTDTEEVQVKKRPTFRKSEDLTKPYFRELGKLPLLTKDEEVKYSRAMELGYNTITRELFATPGMIKLLTRECRCVEDGTRSLDQIARIEFDALFDKKRMWQERQRFIRRVNAINRETTKLKTMLRQEKTKAMRSVIGNKREKILQKIIYLSLQHHMINKFIQHFRVVAKEILTYGERLKVLEKRKGDVKGKRERRLIHSKLKQHEKFLGRTASEISEQLKRIEKLEEQILQSRDKMIEGNVRLVISIAKRYTNRGLDFADLLEEGNCGLIKAVEKFNYHKGFKFSTYATWWIKQAITRSIADHSRTVRVPSHIIDALNKISRTQRKFVQSHGREPTTAEIAKRLSIPKEKIESLTRISQFSVSLDKPIDDEESSFIGDFIADEKAISPTHAAGVSILQEKLEGALSVLSKREEKVIRLRFGLGDGTPRTLEEIGQIFNITRERVRQIEAKALQKLRHPVRMRQFEELKELLR
jgi:RNA polymerase primary sigma factor